MCVYSFCLLFCLLINTIEDFKSNKEVHIQILNLQSQQQPNTKMVKIQEAKLGSSAKTIPLIGLGTAEYPFATSEETKQAILEAIQVGYRHFDTAALYFTEQSLGEAIAEALRLGLIQSRDELFITSKLWCNSAHKNLVLPALQNTLK